MMNNLERRCWHLRKRGGNNDRYLRRLLREKSLSNLDKILWAMQIDGVYVEALMLYGTFSWKVHGACSHGILGKSLFSQTILRLLDKRFFFRRKKFLLYKIISGLAIYEGV